MGLFSLPIAIYRPTLFLCVGLSLVALMTLAILIAFCVTDISGCVEHWVVSIGIFLFAAFFCVGSVGKWKERVERYADRLVVRHLFGRKEMLFNEYRGYRIAVYQFIRVITFYPKEASRKPFELQINLDAQSEFIAWAQTQFDDLDAAEYDKNFQEIIADKCLGKTKSEREDLSVSATRVARMLNYFSIGLGLWGAFYPKPYTHVLILLGALPVAALVAMRFYKGIITLDEKPSQVRPSIILAYLIPPITLSLRAILDWSLLDFSLVLWPIGIAGAGIATVSALCVYSCEPKVSNILIVIVVSMVMAFGIVFPINGLCDTDVGTIHTAEVLDKWDGGDVKSVTYHLKLGPWGPRKEANEVSVDQDLYNIVEKGERVNVHLFRGYLSIPWLYVTDSDKASEAVK